MRPEQSHTYAAQALGQLAKLVWPADGAEQHHEAGYGYWLGLVSAYFKGIEQAILPALMDRYDVVIIENWCYKFAAKLMLKGYQSAALRQHLPLTPCLDVVFIIDAPPEQAWQRKERFSYVELGGQDGYAELGRGSFIDYQRRLRSHLLSFADQSWIRVDNSGESLDEACLQVEGHIKDKLNAAKPMALHE